MSQPQHIERVAIVGAAGNLGSHITAALLQKNVHTITAITRIDSNSTFPDSVTVQKVDYEKHDSLVSALRGQDALVITMSGRSAIQSNESKLITAAAEAGVPWILPNEWSPDSANEKVAADIPIMVEAKAATRALVEKLGKSSYIAVVTGYWYEYMLLHFGIDLNKRTAVLYDEGNTKVSLSTWPQIGRAVAAILSLPLTSAGKSGTLCLEDLKNKHVYIDSFTISQRDMLASALRVTNTKQEDWIVSNTSAQATFDQGMKQIKEGDFKGFSKISARYFVDDGVGNFEHSKGTMNNLLGLPQIDLDEATRAAWERTK